MCARVRHRNYILPKQDEPTNAKPDVQLLHATLASGEDREHMVQP